MDGQAITSSRDLISVPGDSATTVALNGSLCETCGRHFFPRVERCAVCGNEEVKPVTLGRKGKLYSYTTCHFPPPGGKYTGPIPFTAGIVALDEGILIQTRLVRADGTDFRPEVRVELCVESWEDRNGAEVVCPAYRIAKD